MRRGRALRVMYREWPFLRLFARLWLALLVVGALARLVAPAGSGGGCWPGCAKPGPGTWTAGCPG
jgi:hypothetical protein